MSNIQVQFEEAVASSKSIATKPDNETLLQLYALYKQATIGDAAEKGEYGMFDFVAKAKHEAWKKLKGLSVDKAMQDYVTLVNSLNS